MKNSGFTLAEVLITLAVVGIVASVTIPAIVNNANEATYKKKWLKAFSTFSQATTIFITDNGGTLKGNFTSNEDWYNAYSPHLAIIKACSTGSAFGICWHDNDGSTKLLNGDPVTWLNNASVHLKDGIMVKFTHQSASCTAGAMSNTCGYITIDVNGFSPPNTVGKDIYRANILENRLVPTGSLGDSYVGTCDAENSGWGCSYEYLYNN